MSGLDALGDEAHREHTASRTHESHARLARNGHVTGGRVFGYRNKDVVAGVDAHGRRLRSHVEREVAAEEAAIVRQMFEWYDSGLGLEAKRDGLARDIAALRPVPRLPPAVIESRLAEWRRLLRQSPTQARAVLQRVLVGWVTFTPDGRSGYAFAAPTRYDRLFTGSSRHDRRLSQRELQGGNTCSPRTP